MSASERRKGANGEREFAAFLREHLGCADARRGCQHRGGPDSPDVLCGIPGTHVECKRTEKLKLHAAMKQAISEAPEGHVPYVAHRRNRDEWLVTLRAKDLSRLAQCIAAVAGTPIYPHAVKECDSEPTRIR